MTDSSAPDPVRATAAPPAGIRTLVFDVLGTVVDEAGSIAAETAAALSAAGSDPGRGPELAADWMRRLDAMISLISTGDAARRSNDALRRAALLDALRIAGLDGLPPGVIGELALAGHRLRPWPDSARALQSLAGASPWSRSLNADLAQLANFSAAGGLAWHRVPSAELVKAYKPDPAVYRLALDLLGLNSADHDGRRPSVGPAVRRGARNALCLRLPARRGNPGSGRQLRRQRREPGGPREPAGPRYRRRNHPVTGRPGRQ